MELEKLFETVESLREKAHVEAVFGKPETIGEKTIIPIAQVGYGFGMGFGEGKAPGEGEGEEAPTGRGGGGGGGVFARPIAFLEVTAEETKLTPIVDSTKLFLAGMAMAAWSIFWISRTLARVFSQRKAA